MTAGRVHRHDDNRTIYRLGQIARQAGDPRRKDVGDLLDRGLILLHLLEVCGFELHLSDASAASAGERPE